MPYDAPPEGNDWGAWASSQPSSLPPDSQLSGFARLSIPNVFTDVNTFDGGIRLTSKTVSSDYTATHNDYEILVDASSGNVTITLPEAIGDGQLYRIKKIDDSVNIVTISPQSGDLIDGLTGLSLTSQWDAASIIDAALNYWDKVSDPTGNIPSDVARQNSPNVFTALNTFGGIRVATATIFGDTDLNTSYFEVLVDASAGPVIVSLPASTGEGQYYRIKKIDNSENVVTIQANGSDLIDGSTSINFFDQYADATIVDASLGYWDNTGSAETGDEISVTSAQLASVSATLEAHIDAVSAAVPSASVTSSEVSALVQIASAAATSADAHANTVSGRVVSVSAELASLVQIASAAATSADTHANTASAAAASADAHANTVSARVVSVSAELASVVQIASAAATSADNHANTVSQRVVSVSAEINSLLNSVESRLSTRIDAASTGGGSVTSQEVSALVQIASAAATSVDARVTSINNSFASLSVRSAGNVSTHGLQSIINAISTKLSSNATRTSALSSRATSISAELASLVNIASAAATSADAHANTVSGRVVSVSAELNSLLNSVESRLSTRIDAASTGGSVTSQEVSALVQAASAAATSADAHADTISGRVVSVSAELASLLASASATLETHAAAASAAATSAINKAVSDNASLSAVITASINTVSARVVSVSAELGSLVQIASAAATSADAHANTVSARLVSVSAELISDMESIRNEFIASIGAHIDNVSQRVTSVSAELMSQLASTSAALEIHINAVSAAGGGGSVTSNEVSVAIGAAISLTSINWETRVDVLSAALNSKDNAISGRVVSVSAELGSLIQIASAAATSADAHANTVSGRAVSISAELASLVQIASAAATSAINKAVSDNTSLSAVITTSINTVSARVVSVSAELGSLIQIASAAATSVNTRVTNLTFQSLGAGTTSATMTLGENTGIALDPAGSADGKWSGITVAGTGGDTIAFGDLVTLDKDDSRWEKVDISVAAAATGDARGLLGIAVTSSTDGAAITVLLMGLVRADANFPALTIGAAVYASTTGDVVVTQPTTTDHVIRIVGHAATADELMFNPSPHWITHT